MMRKAIAGILVAMLLLNLVLFGMRKISLVVFWVVIGIAAVIAYWFTSRS